MQCRRTLLPPAPVTRAQTQRPQTAHFVKILMLRLFSNPCSKPGKSKKGLISDAPHLAVMSAVQCRIQKIVASVGEALHLLPINLSLRCLRGNWLKLESASAKASCRWTASLSGPAPPSPLLWYHKGSVRIVCGEHQKTFRYFVFILNLCTAPPLSFPTALSPT